MGDSLRSGISTDIRFGAGETPSPEKLSAITSQLRRAVSQVESAIGDIHGESWPYTTSTTSTLSMDWGQRYTSGSYLSGTGDRRLDIANLARLIGPASNLNPKMLSGQQSITEDIPVGVHEFSLRYPVDNTSAVSTTDPNLSNKRVSQYNLQIAGDWHVGAGGKIRSFSATSGGTVTYTTTVQEWGGGMNFPRARFNVIPDPNQIENGNGCSIGALDGQGRRPITLPVISHQQSNIALDSVTLDTEDINDGKQLELPRVLVENLTSGDIIPEGFLFLKNETTGEVYEDGVYTYSNASSLLISNVDLAAAITAGNKFSIITVGTDITTTLDDIRNKLHHSHDRSFGEPYVHISNIIGQYQSAGASGVFGPSEIPGNSFSQYLHRDGFIDGVDDNLNDLNCMRGPIVMGLNAGSAGNYTGSTGGTYAIRFGDLNTGSPYIRRDSSNNLLINHDNLNVVVDVNSSSPNSAASPALVVDGGPVRAPYGFRSLQNGSNLAVFHTALSWNTGTKGASSRVGAGPLAPVEDKEWAAVHAYLAAPGAGGEWMPPSITVLSSGLLLWEFFWQRPVATSELYAVVDSGSSWLAATSYSMLVTIWYYP